MRAEAYILGKKVCAIEDTGFSNVDQIMDKLVTMLPKKTRNARVQFKITNVDKNSNVSTSGSIVLFFG